MKIIIIGCGKVGVTLGAQLAQEEHDVVLIDESAARIQGVPEEIDAIKLVGNGASIAVQTEAGVETADIMIAVTGSDELNLLCCVIAKKAGNCHTIARVRNPVYYQEIGFIQEKLGISMILNPELAAANEISRILRFPSAITIDPFAKGRAELVKFKVQPEFRLDGLSVMDIDSKYHCDVLISGVERGDEVVIPDGKYVIHDGDIVSIMAAPRNSMEFFKKIGVQTNPVTNTMIIGGSKIAVYLARQLTSMRIRVKIIERDRKRCEELCEHLPDTLIINGDGSNRDLLREEGLDKAEAFVTLTSMDEENVFLALFAKEISRAKLVTKINRMATTNASGAAVVGAEVEIENPDQSIFLGVEAKVEVHMATAADVVTVPVEVVNTDREGDFVFVAEEGLVKKKRVTTGISSDTDIEIQEGLTAGEAVIMTTGQELEEGTPVTVLPQNPGMAE